MNQTPYSYMPNPYMPNNGIVPFNTESITELERRISRLERQVKRLEQRVFHSENINQNDYSTSPPKDKGMYMM